MAGYAREATVSQLVNHYTTTYSHFTAAVNAQIRQETFGEDIGQNSWLTAGELGEYVAWLGLTPAAHLLDVGCGSGGPALFVARMTGSQVTGIDINEHGIAQARRIAQAQLLADRVQFQQVDASERLPFAAAIFDAVICIDAISHLPARLAVLNEWYRVLKPGGGVLFTDPMIVTGLLSDAEISIRTSIASFLLAPPGEDVRLIQEAGFTLERQKDTTWDTATLSWNWGQAREQHRAELLTVETEQTFVGRQRFYAMVHMLSRERRLSRYAFLARKAPESTDSA